MLTASPVLERDGVAVEVRLDPFALFIRRDGVLFGPISLWTAEGAVEDRFIQLTEGVVARERVDYEARVEHALVEDTGVFDGLLSDGKRADVRVSAPHRDAVLIEVSFRGDVPMRVGAEWPATPGEHWTGLGPRHVDVADQAGRSVRLSADRLYAGSACPPDLLSEGGLPQGDYAPVPFALSSASPAVWLDTWGEGAQFELGDPVRVSARGAAGTFRLWLFTDRGVAARLRHYCRLTGFPMLLPEWGYGHWKSRDVHPHQDDVLDDLHGYRWHDIPLDAIVIDSPWETQYNTWEFNPRQFPDPAGMIARLRASGVRTVVWITPWVNLDSAEGLNNGQVPPDGVSERLHRQPAPNYFAAERDGHFIRDGAGGHAGHALVDGHRLAGRRPLAERVGVVEGQAKKVLDLGVEGIKADDGEGFYIPPDAQLADGRTGAEAAWAWSDAYRSGMQRALDEATGGSGVLFARSGWSGGQRHGMLWGGDQVSDFWSLRALLVATLTAAGSGYSNWSHDVGGYLGRRMVERCDRELLVRWVQFGCFTPLMQAHGRFAQEAWTYDRATLGTYRDYVVLHERLVPYIRAAASLATRAGVPIIRPLGLVDPTDARGWGLTDSYFFGPSLWVAPVVWRDARSRRVWLPRGEWIDWWTGEAVSGEREVSVEAPIEKVPLWVRSGSILPTYPEDHIQSGLGHTPEASRPLEATLWGRPRSGRASVRLADGTRIRWTRGEWSVTGGRELTSYER